MATVEGVPEWKAAIRRKLEAARVATEEATRDALHLLERDTKRTLTTYSHPRGTPTPSPPGQPPALITGHLRRSVTVYGPRTLGMTVTGEIGPTTVYARIQELGGWTGRGHRTYLPPRPYLLPTVTGDWQKIARLYRTKVARALRS